MRMKYFFLMFFLSFTVLSYRRLSIGRFSQMHDFDFYRTIGDVTGTQKNIGIYLSKMKNFFPLFT